MAEFYSRSPGRTQAQVQQRADRQLRLANQFERGVDLTKAGDVNIDPRMMLSLSGTGTSFDMTYQIQTITWVFDEPESVSEYGGFQMTIEAVKPFGSGIPDITSTPGGGPDGDGAQASPEGFDESGFEGAFP